jgi:cytochrome c oxidase subunit III
VTSQASAAKSIHRDDTGSRMGLWLFLFSELILFGGMFIIYAVYRFLHPEEFRLAAAELDPFMGTINTMILLTSSLTVALSITAIQRGKKYISMTFVGTTIVLALTFLIIKYFEWSHKISLGIFPKSPELTNKPEGEILYFGLYYVMTGLHAFHVIVGIVVLVFMLIFISKEIVHKESYVKLEAGALYWHLVDIIWIFLFPLFYLIH